MSSSPPISPTTSPSGCALSKRRRIRRRGSAPMAENMSAQRVMSAESSFLGKVLPRYFYINRTIEDMQEPHGLRLEGQGRAACRPAVDQLERTDAFGLAVVLEE